MSLTGRWIPLFLVGGALLARSSPASTPAPPPCHAPMIGVDLPSDSARGRTEKLTMGSSSG
ncbi:MAG: hypothetical protein IPP58_15090 [Holophagaceae bacterium]|uniref:Secreted protein n=1 Tax=Candidatus Geothrix skivensis TaxID=2954439 RepID=A0A9D7SJ79_9BACT|nr:hypothetical protein [Candidatus Geothrix skivensis]